jgi:hypothetical protein
MDPERDNYADNDLPPPRRLPPVEIILGLVGGVFVVVLVAAFLLRWWIMASV